MSTVNRDLADIKELLELSESMLGRQCSELAKRLKKESENLSEEQREFLVGWFSVDFSQLQEIFPRIQRYSLFTTVMSSVESDLYRICVEIQNLQPTTKKFKKPRNNIIKGCIEYLEKCCRTDLSKLDIKEIDMYRRIRNCIVHSEGKNSDSKPLEVETFCQQKPTLSIDKHGYIVIEENFLQIVIHVITEFFKSLIGECKKKLKVQQHLQPDAE
jgi:hypothetical protein